MAFEEMTRAVVGITMASLDALDHAVSLPQFRLLLTLDGLGRVPSSRLAAALGLGASAVTRLGDRLLAAGLIARGTDERNRSIVTLEVTAAGHELVTRVVERRHALLAEVLDRMSPRERSEAARVAGHFAELAAGAATPHAVTPLPL